MEKEIAILMADLTGYTAMTDVHGGASAAKVVKKYMQIVDAALYGKTKLVQRIGDQVVMIAKDPNDLLETAKNLDSLTREEHHFLSIHAGLHFGKILIEDNNLFGSTINIAARIMNVACRGQILCSSAFFDHLPASSKQFRSIGIHKLKNLISDIELFEIIHQSGSEVYIDPVCHMQINNTNQSPSSKFKGSTFYFCSEHCQTLFLKASDRFVSGIPEM
jgi:adenylate cyclase